MKGIAHRLTACATALAAAGAGAPALAQQKSAENAVTSADDAFGSSVGLESTGIYSENSARGFSPIGAGNSRLDGIYFDPVSLVTLRMKASQAMRVGYAALEYPFPAPTGIVDDRLRSSGEDFTAGLAWHRQQYGSYVTIADFQIPVLRDHLSIAAGLSQGNAEHVDGATGQNYSFAVKPVARFAGIEFSPFYSANYLRDNVVRPIVLANGATLPEVPRAHHYYGSRWAKGSFDNVNYGGTLKAKLTDRLSLRAGLFHSEILRRRNYTEILSVSDESGLARHFLIADPRQRLHSLSGEAQLAWALGGASGRHRLIVGFRGRDRVTQSGGSDTRDFGTVLLGEPDTETMPEFRFTPVNRGSVKQTAWLLGYLGRIEGLGQLNLGLQRGSFHGVARGASGTTRTRENAWLYNASIGVDLSRAVMLYGGTQRGLEDSGAAPESAANRNEQMPPARSTQYEAGLRWKLPHTQLVLSAFEITKPYFSFGAGRVYTRLGTVRHRGLEASFSGHLIDNRLSLLVGAQLMQAHVTGPGRDAGLVGKHPVATRGVRVRMDSNYRTDLWGGFTPTLSVNYRGAAAAGAAPLPALGGRQLKLPSRVSLDIGFRQPLKLGRYPATIRGKIQDVLDQKEWIALASNTLQMADRRRMSLDFLIDF